MIAAELLKNVRSILCLGAHSDDIEIGCGGTILRLMRENPAAQVHWIVFSGNATRAAEAHQGAKLFVAGAGLNGVHSSRNSGNGRAVLIPPPLARGIDPALLPEPRKYPRNRKVQTLNFRDGHFPSQFSTIKAQFEQLKSTFRPDLIFTHFRDDAHQDHRTIQALTWNTWRDNLILEYEIPKYDGDLGHPNFFVPLTRATCVKKAKLLHRAFNSQTKRQWFDEDAFLALPRLRGIECNSPTGWAEGFHCRKLMA